MILADKIIKERKKLGLSQEELAEKMNVSRQAVSKWEGNQSVPEIEKILQLSRLFGVTTDYLLKDEIENEESAEKSETQFGTEHEAPSENMQSQAVSSVVAEKSGLFPFNNKFVSIGASDSDNEEYKAPSARTVTAEQAREYMSRRKKASIFISIGTFLCIVSVIPLFLLGVMSESSTFGLSEDGAGVVGLIILLVLVAAAVGLFVYTGFRNSPFEFLEKEPFETESGVVDMVREQREAFNGTYVKFNLIGTVLCVLSPIPLFIGALGENNFGMILSLSIMLLIAGSGVVFFILAGVPHEGMQRLLKDGEYSEEAKKSKGIKGAVALIYWLVAAVIYLLILFLTGGGYWEYDKSWVVWPVAGVLFPAVMTLCGILEKKDIMQKMPKEEGENSEAAKKSKVTRGAVALVYWFSITIIYLVILFLSKGQDGNWIFDNSWVIWPVAGVLFPTVIAQYEK